jgi:hypothetical protein
MNEIVVTPDIAPRTGEAEALARELAAAYQKRVRYHNKGLGLPLQDAVAKVEEPCSLDRMWEIEDCPPEEVTWETLEELNRRSPGLALQRYEELKRTARDLLRSGDLAGAALDGCDPQPWERAKFLAIRDDLSERDGIERGLLDQMALAQAEMFRWQGRRAQFDSLADQEAAEKAAAMLERFHRMFIRAQRALQELRRRGPAVLVQNVGPVQVGGQQLNVAQQGNGRNGHAQRRGQGRRRPRRAAACICPGDRAVLIRKSG